MVFSPCFDFGRLAGKTVSDIYDLFCVKWDVKPYVNQLIKQRHSVPINIWQKSVYSLVFLNLVFILLLAILCMFL